MFELLMRRLFGCEGKEVKSKLEKAEATLKAIIDIRGQDDAFKGPSIKPEWRKNRYLPAHEYKMYAIRKAKECLEEIKGD